MALSESYLPTLSYPIEQTITSLHSVTIRIGQPSFGCPDAHGQDVMRCCEAQRLESRANWAREPSMLRNLSSSVAHPACC
jgi:hypothetical protein